VGTRDLALTVPGEQPPMTLTAMEGRMLFLTGRRPGATIGRAALGLLKWWWGARSGTSPAFELQVQLLDGRYLWIVPPESVGMQPASGSLTVACSPGVTSFEVQLECRCLQLDQGEDALSLAMVLADFSGFKENTVKDKGEFVWPEDESPLPMPKEMSMEELLAELDRVREAAPFSRLLGAKKAK